MQNIFISSLEKAIIDSIYLGVPAFSYVEEAFLSAIEKGILDINELKILASRMNSKAVSEKISYLIDAEAGRKNIRGKVR